MLFYELIWLWKLLGIALVFALLAVGLSLLISRLCQRKMKKRFLLLIGIVIFLLTLAVLFVLAQTPMPV